MTDNIVIRASSIVKKPIETITTEIVVVDGAKETIRKILRMSRARNEPPYKESSRLPVITLLKFVTTLSRVS